MRRTDREIGDLSEIAGVLRRCDTIRLGIADAKAPYVVPVSFGYELQGGRIAVYFHGALAGRKAELLQERPLVCVEADLCHGFVENGHGGLTCDFESVIGYGTAELLEGEEKRHGLELLLEHCGVPHYQCTPEVTAVTAVYRIVLDTVTGKRRFENRS
ncbi:MAG: pyridoxamine 5'-phosphate oxidase family protein [Eubacteriales bacterium]|nr:pyridoxamine 5'-phosphate oxidase family protein [Eubacteriales bacterium]